MELVLREYQQKTIDKIRDLFRGGTKRVCICLPTGAGKTAIAVSIMQKTKGLVYFIVPRLELAGQTSEALAMYPHGFCMAGKETDQDRVLICSLPTLRRRMKTMRAPQLIIIDEVHTNYEAQIDIINQWPDSYVIGLTATPERQSGASLKRICNTGCTNICKLIRQGAVSKAQEVIAGGRLYPEGEKSYTGIYDTLYKAESIPGLQAQGYLAKLKYITVQKSEWERKNNIAEVTDEEEIKKYIILGDVVKKWVTYGMGYPSIGFSPTIKLAEIMRDKFHNAGYKNWEVIHGGMALQKRAELIRKLRSNELNLINAALLTYGFDAPEVRYAFSIRHIFSRPLWVQMVGRVLRPSPGKEYAFFVDHGGSCYNFGTAEDFFFDNYDPPWMFEGDETKKCMFNTTVVCNYKPFRPPCIFNSHEKCGTPEYWGKAECIALKYKYPRLCYYTDKPITGGPRAQEIEQVESEMEVVNMGIKIERLAGNNLVFDLCNTAARKNYKPYWVLYRLRDLGAFTMENIIAIRDFYHYKPGWERYILKTMQA